MFAWIAGLLCIVLISAVNGSPIKAPETKDESYRLVFANTPKPLTYDVTLTPNLEQSTFTGNLTLTVTPTVGTKDKITLHSRNITVSKVTVKVEGGDDTDLWKGTDFDDQKDFLIITTEGDLDPNNNYTIEIEYSGILHDDMYGFYKSVYVDDDGVTRTLASTQFQPTHARKAFPCFDEPKYKAKFQITINTPNGFESLSNTPVNSKEQSGEYMIYKFEETPIMSTYLIAFIVSDFVALDSTQNGIEYKTWARSNAIKSGEYSIQVTPLLLQSLEDYTGIPYSHSSLTKVDQAALPDFSAGAMENWGLITYRERALLYTEGVSTSSAKETIVTIIAHELAHMWFGNLVTTDWWDSTWLNEGFATYFENYIASKVEESMRIMDQFVVTVHQAVFASDSLSSAHPLTSVCNTPAEVSAMFSSITYSKGGSILRMLNHSLTEERFKAALNAYLTEREFDTSIPSQLMKHLSDQAQLAKTIPKAVDFTAVVQSWTEQAGFPVITVERDYTQNTSKVSQSRFLLNPEGNSGDQTWYVPLNWASTLAEFEDTTPKQWLTEKEMEIAEMPPADQWVIFNVQETGFYRVNYDEQNWNLIATALTENRESIHLLNRAQLIDDALNLARADMLPYATVFKIADSLVEETDYIPWLAGLNGLSFLNRRVMGHAEYPLFQKFVLLLLDKVYKQLEFEDKGSHVDKLHRRSVLTWACNMGHEECLQSATQMLNTFATGGDPVKPDLQSVVYCYGLKKSENNTAWTFLWNQYIASNDATEKTLLLSSLGCSNDQGILQEYLLKSINDEAIRKQDAASVFSAVYGNPAGVDTALAFLAEHFDSIVNYYGSMGGIGNIVRGLAAQITTEEQKTQFETFLDANAAALGQVTETAKQTVAENLAWSTKFQEDIFKVLREREGGGGGSGDGGSGSMVAPGVATFLATLVFCVFYLF